MDTNRTLPVKLQPSNIRPIVYRILSKKHSLNIKTDALEVLTEVISNKFGVDWRGPVCQKFLEAIAKTWKLQDRGLFVDGAGLKQIVKELNQIESRQSSPTSSIIASRSDTIVDLDLNGGEIEEDLSLNWEDFFKVVNPDDQMNFTFDKTRRQFLLIRNGSRFQAHLEAQVHYFSNRYNLISDRLSRNESFHKTSISSIASINQSMLRGKMSNEITLISNVLGRDGSRFILFGFMTKNYQDKFILEDSSGCIELNLQQAIKQEGSFYCPGMFIIVEGIYSSTGGNRSSESLIGGCFHVSTMSHPPAERRDQSIENYGNIDFLGIQTSIGVSLRNIVETHALKIPKPLKRKLGVLEKSLLGHKLIFMGSDCFLDDFKTLEAIKKFFIQLEQRIDVAQTDLNVDDGGGLAPLAVIMVGSFISKPLSTSSLLSASSTSNAETYKELFNQLASILGTNCPNLIRRAKLVLIPGLNDPWQSEYSFGGSQMNVFPQKSIPTLFASRLERLLPRGNLIFGWNPTRISYLSQEMVIMKDDIFNKCKRNDIVLPHDIKMEQERTKRQNMPLEEMVKEVSLNSTTPHISPKVRESRKLVKTLLDQGTLQPFLKNLKVVNASYDYALRIEPLPTTIILHDANFEFFEVTYNGCKVINVPRLIGTTRYLNYVEYTPSRKKFHYAKIFF